MFLIKRDKLTQRAVAEQLKISQTTVWKVWQKYRETKSVHDRPKSGRKRKLGPSDERAIIAAAKRRKSASEIAQKLKKKGKQVCPETVRTTLKNCGFAYLKIQETEELSERHKAERLAYAQDMMNYDWKQVIFTDEKSFWLGSGQSHCWQRRDERITRQVKRHPKKLHVWAGIGYYGKFKLYLFEENLKAPLYQKILRARLPESEITYAPHSTRLMRKKWIFLQDNDPKHKAAKSMQLLEELIGDRYLHHPASSPDLNPMENIWSYLNRKVQAAEVTTIQCLRNVLRKEWKSMPWEEIRVAVDSMPSRLQQCIERGGGRTDY